MMSSRLSLIPSMYRLVEPVHLADVGDDEVVSDHLDDEGTDRDDRGEQSSEG